MKVKFTVTWEVTIRDDELLVEMCEENEEPDMEKLRTEWLESQAEAIADDPSNIPDVPISIDYEVLHGD